MLSGKIKPVVSTTAFRLAAWYSSIFILSALALFLLAFHMLSDIVAQQDRARMKLKLNEYLVTAREEGMNHLLKEIKREKKDYRSAGFFVRLADRQNRTLVCSLPRRFKDIDCSRPSSFAPDGSQGLFILKRHEDADVLEIVSARLPDGSILQVGKSSTERENLLARFFDIFMTISVLVAVLGLAAGTFMSFKALSPLRDLIQTVQKIRAGSLDARVQVKDEKSQGHDELDILARLFNEMLDKIDTLVRGMREALDYVAHDLRTPVTRLRAIAESTLQRQNTKETLEAAIMDCAEEAERISVILSSLMDLSEAEAGVMQLDLKRQPLAPVIRDAVELYEYVAEEKDILVETDIPENLALYLDKNRLGQAAANLIDNAIKYGKRGGRLDITAREDKDFVVISFSDNGAGISAGEIPRIFDRLYRGDKSRSQKGLGLGLCIVKAVAAGHGGFLEVDSTEGIGTNIRIFLPMKRGGLQ